METIIICAIFGIFILLSFTIGLHYGTKVGNKEPINIPNPIKSYNNHKEETKLKKEYEREMDIMKQELENINNYDGTGNGQKDII